MTRLIRAIRRWHLRSDLRYCELYLAALASQPRPDEAAMRAMRDQIGELHIRLATLN